MDLLQHSMGSTSYGNLASVTLDQTRGNIPAAKLGYHGNRDVGGSSLTHMDLYRSAAYQNPANSYSEGMSLYFFLVFYCFFFIIMQLNYCSVLLLLLFFFKLILRQ